jgi:PAS domain S-box-containing protein
MARRPIDDQKNRSFLSVLENITDGFICLDANWRYSYLNPAAKRVLERQGITDILGKHIFEEVFPDSRNTDAGRAIARVMKERIPLELETFSPRAQRWFANRIIPTDDGGVSILFNDITDRKQAEQALRRAMEFDEAVMKSMGEGLYTVDDQGLVTMMNPAAEKLFGWTTEELRGKRMHDVTHYAHPDGSLFPATDCAGLKVLRQGTVLTNYSDVFIRKNGTFFDVVYSSSPIREGDRVTGLVVVFRDVSEQKRSEELIKQNARQLGLIADTAPVFIAHCDLEHRFLFVNKPYAERFGLKPEDCIGKSIAEIIGEDAYETLRKYVEIVLKGERIDFGLEVPYSKIGKRYMHCSYAPEFDADGKVIGWVTAIIDITERKRAEEALQDSQQQLRQALEAAWEASRLKDEFLATVSHELRTPLQSILGWAGLLRNPNSKVDTTSAIDSIYKSAKNQAQTIEDLLDVSRIITGKLQLKPQSILINVVVQNVVESVQPALLVKNISLRLNLSEDKNKPIVYGDPDRLQQVIWNLLVNAIKFTAENGIIQIETRKVGKNVEVVVSDNGKGISPEFMPFLFDRFRQADSSSTRTTGGLGLGLSIVKQLVELHGGTVEARSKGADQGSTFIITLPVGASLSETNTSQDLDTKIESSPQVGEQLSGLSVLTALTGPLNGRNILFVEDDMLSAEMFRSYFESKGANTKMARRSSEALSILNDWIPDVLVSDLGLPEQDGFSLIKNVRSSTNMKLAALPAIAVTGYGKDDGERAIEAGFGLYLLKPIELSGLEQAVIHLLDPARTS